MTDVCVIGAGPVGLALAAALRLRNPAASVVVLDRGDARPDDGKAVAFRPETRAFLKELGAWPEREQPLRRAEVSFPSPFPPLHLRAEDGRAEGGRTEDGRAEDGSDESPALAFIAPHDAVRDLLLAKVGDIVRPMSVLELRNGDDFAEAVCRETTKPSSRRSSVGTHDSDAPASGSGDGSDSGSGEGFDKTTIRAKAVVVACAFSNLPPGFGVVRDYDYGQCALTFSADADAFPPDTAFERFTSRGILTLVSRAPALAGMDKVDGADGTGRTDGTDGMNGAERVGGVDGWGGMGGRIGVVICAGSESGAEWNGLSDASLSLRIDNEFGGRFGLRAGGPRLAHAPRLRRIMPLARGRIFLAGQAATIVHPVGAQGLNLALRDANILSQMLSDSLSGLSEPSSGFPEPSSGFSEPTSAPIPIPDLARHYTESRRRDHFTVATATHTLALLARRRMFPLRIAGGLFCALASPPFAAPLRAQLAKAATQ